MVMTISLFLQSGLTPIHVAAFMGHENIVHALTHHGASPNTTNVVSKSFLMMHCYMLRFQVQKYTFFRISAQISLLTPQYMES